MFPQGTKPLQTTYPREFIDRVVAATPGNGLLHRKLTWNIAGVETEFVLELVACPHTPEELGAIRQLFDEQQRLAVAA